MIKRPFTMFFVDASDALGCLAQTLLQAVITVIVKFGIAELSQIFAIEICAYAIMSNHYHLVLRIDAQTAQHWSDKTVIRRWMKLYKGHPLTNKIIHNKPLSAAEQLKADEIITEWRQRLYDISWLMRCLNEHIARMANAEDKCSGRFWEGRFKSQALLDEPAILTCMAYVDLNPVRAGMAKLPETSDFTAIEQRIVAHKKSSKPKTQCNIKLAKFCKPPASQAAQKAHTTDSVHQGQRATGSIPFYWQDYLDLIDWTGRAILPNKSGSIPLAAPKILERLQLESEGWLSNMPTLGTDFHHCIGCADSITPCAEKLQQHWIKGLGAAKRLFGR
ncbi:transposase [Marinagarivorans algicola]|uniref:transposase n=1 Tax=Marinagarivorans algicola TaxID=1513270 RepID=UPI0037369069